MRDSIVKRASIGDLYLALRRGRAGNIIVLFVVVQVVAILCGIIFPNAFRYLDQSNIQLMLKAIPSLVIITLGVNLLMISGEFDLSVGATFTFTALVMAKLFNAHFPIAVAVPAALILGAGIGLLNGFIVVKTNVPSFIVTLGAMWFWRGVILIVSQAITESFYPSVFFTQLFTLNVGPIQIQFIWALLIAMICWFLLERHKVGNFFFGVGGNRNAASALGVNVGGVKIIAFGITGFLTAFAGIMSTVRINSISPIQGEGLELQAIAACVIGGTALMGGKGTILGAFLGAALMFTIQDILLLLQAPGFYLRMFVGIVIVIAAALNELLKKE
jgi:ribose/xylose/arabinose/galactoside ABC-type transport system permease subunit